MRNFWDECWANQSVFSDFTTSNEGVFWAWRIYIAYFHQEMVGNS